MLKNGGNNALHPLNTVLMAFRMPEELIPRICCNIRANSGQPVADPSGSFFWQAFGRTAS